MNRIFITLMLIVPLLGRVSAVPAQAAVGGSTIPVELVAEPDSDGYIQPNCSKCEDVTLETQASGSQAVLTLVFHDEHQRDFVGAIELTVVHGDDTEDVVVIADEWLTEGEEAGWTLDAPSDWSWDDVGKARLELIAG